MRIRRWRLVGAGGWWWGRPVCPHASHESRDRRASAHTMTAARWYNGLTDPHCPAGSAADAALKVAGTGGALRDPSASAAVAAAAAEACGGVSRWRAHMQLKRSEAAQRTRACATRRPASVVACFVVAAALAHCRSCEKKTTHNQPVQSASVCHSRHQARGFYADSTRAQPENLDRWCCPVLVRAQGAWRSRCQSAEVFASADHRRF